MGELELDLVLPAGEERGFVASIAVTDRLVLAVGGTVSQAPFVAASSNARRFAARTLPHQAGLRDVLAIGHLVWTCGERGVLARSTDDGASWELVPTGTDVCLFALAAARDGAVWVVGDGGFAARVLGDDVRRVDLGTTARLVAAYAIRDDIVVLASDGNVVRWRDRAVTAAATGATAPLTALAISRLGTWIVVGDGGFVARSPDGAWFARTKSGVTSDLEDVATLVDGRLVAVGDRGLVLVSRDDGRTWTQHATQLDAHLWSVERFGGGVLIGGDGGLVARLAPRGDDTWSDRVDVFGGARPLDAVFAPGPASFVARGLASFVEHAPAGDAEPLVAGDFRAIYGVPPPAEASAFFAALAGRDRERTFHELHLDRSARDAAGEHNLFEELVVRAQHEHRTTELVAAFCGVFPIGSQSNGDTYCMEIYEWDGPRQILHFDHEAHAFSGVLADSLDSLAYLVALFRARDERTVSEDAFRVALRKLRGKIAPSWHFAIHDHDREFVRLEPKRRDTEFFHQRARWICALLAHDRVALDDIPQLFDRDLNQGLPPDQLAARLETCAKFIPAALYALWRAYLFGEPELPRYLDVARRHDARLVRDAARLVDDLLGARGSLGTIADVRAWLAAFRALDLDPRRAAVRTLEDAPAVRDDDDIAFELERTPPARWHELAWRWLDNGAAHRALLERLDREPAHAAQLAALDDLRALDDDERADAIARLAAELSPALEAILVGSIARGDDLAGVLHRAETASDSDDDSPGWAAIDRALAPIYGAAEPHAHYGTIIPYSLGGNDPIHGISVYLRDEPVPHFHFVTYGFTDLFAKETDDPDESGFGFELTFRLARGRDERDVPSWALNFLQNLGRYVFGTGNRFASGHKMGLNGPIALDRDTKITAILFTDDPELAEIESPFGKARFVQVVGITDDEYKLIQEWSTSGLVDILRAKLPLLATDLGRDSVLADPVLAREVERRVGNEGSSEDLSFAGDMTIEVGDERVRVELGALYAAAIPRAMRGRIRHGRPYELRGRSFVLAFAPGEIFAHELDDDRLALTIPRALGDEIEAKLRAVQAGAYRFATWPPLELVVAPSFIRDQSGRAIEVRGIADADEQQRLIDAENARLAAEDEDEHEHEHEHDDKDPARARAALALTERALALAPDDADVQHAHAMRAIAADAVDDLLARLGGFAPVVRIVVATRLGEAGHARFEDALEVALAADAPATIVAEGGSANMASYGDVADRVYGDLGAAILDHAPERMSRLVPLLPPDLDLLVSLAARAIKTGHRDHALAIYERLLALPLPDDGAARRSYVRALNNACISAHAVKAYDTAVMIADRAQPVAHENPHIYHAAACAYAAVGDHARAFAQVVLAIEHDYEHLAKVETDADLGAILDWPEFKELFRAWHARRGAE